MRFLLGSLFLVVSLFAKEYVLGDIYPTLDIQDQFEHNQSITNDDQIILMTFQKSISKDLRDFLNTKKKTFLTEHNTKFIAEISSMPYFITKAFAMPKMRKYPYSVMLIMDSTLGDQFSRVEDKITVFKLKNRKILSIDYVLPKDIGSVF